MLFSVVPEADVLGLRHDVDESGKPLVHDASRRRRACPQALWDTTIVVPFNDAAAVEAAFADNPGEIAAVILEPVMMNIGIVVPKTGTCRRSRTPASGTAPC